MDWISLGQGFALSGLIMGIFWGIYCWHGNPGLVDMAWGINITSVGLFWIFSHTSFNEASFEQWSIAAVLLAWGVRLAVFLWVTRIQPGHKDKRYEAIQAGWKRSERYGYFWNYQLQAVLGASIATVMWWLSHATFHLNWLGWLGLLISMTGLCIESWADLTLHRFVQADNKGKNCERGLWAYSRHPNYFGEWLVWLGFGIIAIDLQQPLGLFSALFIYLIMRCLTGPITERHSLASRGSIYQSYQQRVPMIIPIKGLPL